MKAALLTHCDPSQLLLSFSSRCFFCVFSPLLLGCPPSFIALNMPNHVLQNSHHAFASLLAILVPPPVYISLPPHKQFANPLLLPLFPPFSSMLLGMAASDDMLSLSIPFLSLVQELD